MKAQIYSLVAVLVIVPLLLFILQYVAVSSMIKSDIVEKIISDQVHQFEKIIEKDFEKAVKISTKRALLVMVNDVVTNGRPINNASLTLKELITNGTFDGNESIIMTDNTLDDWKNSILNENTGFDVYLNYYNIAVSNFDGFNLKLTMNFDVKVSDKLDIARIDKKIIRNILVSVHNSEDPIFALHTFGFGTRTISRYPFSYYAKKITTGTNSYNNCSGNVTFDENDTGTSKILVIHNASLVTGLFGGIIAETSDLPQGTMCYIVGANNAINEINSTMNQENYMTIYVDNQTNSVWSLPINEGLEKGYYYSGNGPSFLERLENNLKSSTGSFKTFVNIPDLIETGTMPKDYQSRMAYLYFSNQTNLGCYKIRGLPAWFRINATHVQTYNLTELGYYAC